MDRLTVYCVIPRELAVELHDELREHWRDDPAVLVVVERREADRRRGDRRRSKPRRARRAEQRRIPGAGGRRVGQRRAMAVPAAPPQLPARDGTPTRSSSSSAWSRAAATPRTAAPAT
jgi:hypothetical protein